jgi:methylenetetrahydrofolate dehydrogenase (NADP+)/methenyltetrahydrofolate cyclohydrolase
MRIDGRAIANKIYDDLKTRVARLPFQPVFCDVLVGDNVVSRQYVERKALAAEQLGIRFLRSEFPDTISQDALVENIRAVAATPELCGLIVQLPLPQNFTIRPVLDAIPVDIDVDYLNIKNLDLFYLGSATLTPPTPAAVLALLDSVLSDATGKQFLVVGQGELVGRPVAYILRKRGLNVVTADITTPLPEMLAKGADVIVTATGKPGLVTGEWVKSGAIVIDAGTAEQGGAVVGDVDLASVEPVASWVTPTPGGVGPVTVAKLLENVVMVAEAKANRDVRSET